MFKPTKFFILCGSSLFFVLPYVHPVVAQVPDVGPGVCVDTPSMPCKTPSYNAPSSSGSSSGGSGSSYSGPTAQQRAALQHQQIMNGMMLNTMQGLTNSFMSGFQKGVEQNRQRQLQQQQALLRQAREEMERERQGALAAQRAMERNRKQFQAAKERITGVVRSIGATGATVRPILRVGEETGAFGTGLLKPRDTGALVGMDDTGKVVCGQGLLNAAGAAAINGSQGGLVASLKEAAFLSRQANQAVSGGPLDVACPTGDSNASSLGVDEASLMSEAIQQQSEVFGALYDRIADNMERLTKNRDIAKETEEKLFETRAIQEQAAQAVEFFQAQMPTSQDMPPGSDPPDPDDLAAKKSALAEALAALEESEQTLADVKKSYDQNKSTMEEMERSMESMESLMKKALSDPQGVTELRNELGLPDLSQSKQPG